MTGLASVTQTFADITDDGNMAIKLNKSTHRKWFYTLYSVAFSSALTDRIVIKQNRNSRGKEKKTINCMNRWPWLSLMATSIDFMWKWDERMVLNGIISLFYYSNIVQTFTVCVSVNVCVLCRLQYAQQENCKITFRLTWNAFAK